MTKRWIDFNSLLTALNLLVMVLLVCALKETAGNEFIDGETIFLGVILCLETQVALLLERRRRDPFAILLAYTTILYYAFRIFTLVLYPYSEVFYRFPYDSSDSNFALIFIIVANVFLYGGLYAVKIRRNHTVTGSGWKAVAPMRVVLLMLIGIGFAYANATVWGEEGVPRAISLLSVFLAPNTLVLMTLAYYVLFKRSLSVKFAIAIAVLLAVEMIMHTLMGSRGAIIEMIEDFIYVGLAAATTIKLRRKSVLIGVALVPVLAGLLVGSFAISTYNRTLRGTGHSFDLGAAMTAAGESSAALSLGTSLDILLPPVFSRAGYFDYSAEIIAHRDYYASVINLTSYGKSIVDNILTPGFDVYDQPKTSNALQFIYQHSGEPSKLAVSDTYQSDQLGIYGEFYGLFGYGSLPVLFLIAFSLKQIYVRLSGADPFLLIMKRIVVLYFYLRLINSFGVDWTILEALPLLAAVYIYRQCFACRAMPRLGNRREKAGPEVLDSPVPVAT
jgi:hypothetical protein